jgi:ADP-heptose:LPS heptosyltransferase
VQSLIRRDETVYLVVRSQSHVALTERVKGLAGSILEWQFTPGQMRPGDVFFDMRNHPLQKDYWWGSDRFMRAYPTYRINDILEHICRDLTIDIDLQRLDPLSFTAMNELSQSVLLVPGSAFSFKCWPTYNWLELAFALKDQVYVLGEPDRSQAVSELIESGLRHLPTPTLGDALNAVSSAKAVVAVDTGLMHLAVHQGVSTVALYRHHPIYQRDFAHTRAVIAAVPCAPSCYEEEIACAHNSRPKAGPDFAPRDWSCLSDGFRCMDSLSAAQIRQALDSLFAAPKVQNQSKVY